MLTILNAHAPTTQNAERTGTGWLTGWLAGLAAAVYLLYFGYIAMYSTLDIATQVATVATVARSWRLLPRLLSSQQSVPFAPRGSDRTTQAPMPGPGPVPGQGQGREQGQGSACLPSAPLSS